MDTNARLIAQNKAANALADTIDTRYVETVTAADVKPGDVLVKLGANAFPHPVIIAKAAPVGQTGLVHMVASNGWFTSRPCRASETVIRVQRKA